MSKQDLSGRDDKREVNDSATVQQGTRGTVLTEREASGASVAKVGMARGINANVVHGWRKLAREDAGVVVGQPVEFVPVTLDERAPMAAQAEGGIEVELRRRAVTLKLLWSASAAADSAGLDP